MTIIGKKYVSFKTYDDKLINGISLYVGSPLHDGEGLYPDKFFLNASHPHYRDISTLKVGDEIECTYNKYGKVADIKLVEFGELL